jgi:hypothetical protein
VNGNKERPKVTAGLDLGDRDTVISDFWTPTAVSRSRRVCSAHHPTGYEAALRF